MLSPLGATNTSHLRTLALNERQATLQKIPPERLEKYLRSLERTGGDQKNIVQIWNQTLKLLAAYFKDLSFEIVEKDGSMSDTEKQWAFLLLMAYDNQTFRYQAFLSIAERAGKAFRYAATLNRLAALAPDEISLIIPTRELQAYVRDLKEKKDEIKEADATRHRTLKLIAATLEKRRANDRNAVTRWQRFLKVILVWWSNRKALRILKTRGPMTADKIEQP